MRNTMSEELIEVYYRCEIYRLKRDGVYCVVNDYFGIIRADTLEGIKSAIKKEVERMIDRD